MGVGRVEPDQFLEAREIPLVALPGLIRAPRIPVQVRQPLLGDRQIYLVYPVVRGHRDKSLVDLECGVEKGAGIGYPAPVPGKGAEVSAGHCGSAERLSSFLGDFFVQIELVESIR